MGEVTCREAFEKKFNIFLPESQWSDSTAGAWEGWQAAWNTRPIAESNPIPTAFLSPDGELRLHDPACDPDQFRGWTPLYRNIPESKPAVTLQEVTLAFRQNYQQGNRDDLGLEAIFTLLQSRAPSIGDGWIYDRNPWEEEAEYNVLSKAGNVTTDRWIQDPDIDGWCWESVDGWKAWQPLPEAPK